MDLWFTEKYADSGLAMKVRDVLYRGESPFQKMAVLDTFAFGKVLVLDGAVMLTERDEFLYHEMLAHVPLFTHHDPKRVLVIGGGDGGTVREVLRHPGVEEVILVEIDEKVLEVSREYLPQVSGALSDPRVRVLCEDGVRYVGEAQAGRFDVVLVDSTDPVGPAVALFAPEFFEGCSRILGPDGVFACQSGSPFFNLSLMKDIHGHALAAFPRARFYLAPVMAYPGGTWSFLLGSKGSSPLPQCRREAAFKTRYYTPGIHLASFALPKFVEEAIGG